MEVGDIRIDRSPLAPDRVRLTAVIRYDGAGLGSEELWFDVSDRDSSGLTDSGNPWLAALVPLAAVLGEPLRISRPIDATLAAGVQRVLRIWKAWYPQLSVVDVLAELATSERPESVDRVAAFFSGGADSFFTVLRDRTRARPGERAPIQDLVTVHGFDIPVHATAPFARMRARHETVAERLGLGSVDVVTNLRTTRFEVTHWSYLGHGAALASVALALERAYSTVYIAGGGGYRGLHPWGSHSVTDPLFSTAGTSIVYDGVDWIRTEKVEAIATSAVARDALRVCYQNDDDRNCGTCNKCLRTMVTLDLCGVLDRSATFPHHPDLLGAVAEMDASHFADAREIEDIRCFAEARGRSDVVAALQRCTRRTRWLLRARAGRRWATAPLRGAARLFGRGHP